MTIPEIIIVTNREYRSLIMQCFSAFKMQRVFHDRVISALYSFSTYKGRIQIHKPGVPKYVKKGK